MPGRDERESVSGNKDGCFWTITVLMLLFGVLPLVILFTLLILRAFFR
jgi:hypothetical protein